jgi:hypothetical protein
VASALARRPAQAVVPAAQLVRRQSSSGLGTVGGPLGTSEPGDCEARMRRPRAHRPTLVLMQSLARDDLSGAAVCCPQRQCGHDRGRLLLSRFADVHCLGVTPRRGAAARERQLCRSPRKAITSSMRTASHTQVVLCATAVELAGVAAGIVAERHSPGNDRVPVPEFVLSRHEIATRAGYRKQAPTIRPPSCSDPLGRVCEPVRRSRRVSAWRAAGWVDRPSLGYPGQTGS